MLRDVSGTLETARTIPDSIREASLSITREFLKSDTKKKKNSLKKLVKTVAALSRVIKRRTTALEKGIP